MQGTKSQSEFLGTNQTEVHGNEGRCDVEEY